MPIRRRVVKPAQPGNAGLALARIQAKREGALSAKNSRIVAVVEQRPVPSGVQGRSILAIDPGGSTGLAARLPNGQLVTHTATTPSDLFTMILTKPDVVVYEIFVTGGRVDRYMIHTIKLVGGIEALCYGLKIRAIAHVPQTRYPWLQAAAALLPKGYNYRHEVDATAHLLAFEELGR